MIEKPRLERIANLALPVIAGALAANLMTFVDTLMVGQLGDAALGGVGIAGQLFFLFLTVALGLGAGVQAMVARRVGDGRLDATGKVLNAGLLLAAMVGFLLISFGYLLLPPLFQVLNGDQLVVEEGLVYLSTRMPSLVFLSMSVAFRSYWVGVDMAKWWMVSVVAMSLINIVLNYMLIFGNFGAPRMEVAGAGLGSTLAVLIALLVNVGFALKLAMKNGFLKGLPARLDIINIVRVSYPESVRQMFFTIGVVLMYVLMGQLGTDALAAFHVVINICMLAYLPHIGIGGAATTLVGEALGRNDTPGAKVWGWQVSNVGFFILMVLGVGVALFPAELLGLFLVNESTLALAIIPLQLGVIAHVLDGYGKVIGSALIGAGATKSAMKLTLLPQWSLMLPLMALSVFLGYGLNAAMAIFLGTMVLYAILCAWVWHRGNWSDINL